MQNFQRILKLLLDHDVRFVIIGGFAAAVHGSSVLTEDIDMCTSFDRDNMGRLLDTLKDIHPAHRLVGESRPLDETADKLASFNNLYLSTDLGYCDFLSEVKGVGNFDDVMQRSVEIPIFDIPCSVLDIDALIEAKRGMSRPKDKDTIIQLEAIREKTRT